eukprot:tig00021590_g22765.t1
MKLILGSTSRFRKAVLKDAGYEFTTVSPDIDEKQEALRDPNPEIMTRTIARAKALACLDEIRFNLSDEIASESPQEDYILICSDQVVRCNGEVREKPTSADEARRYLTSYTEGHPAETVTAVVVVNVRSAKFVEGVDIAKQFFKPIPGDVVEALIAKGDIMHCAGSFMVEDPTLAPYLGERIGDVDSIMGLPLALLKRLMSEVSSEKA